MPLKIDGALVVRRDRKNVDLIAVLDFESAELSGNGIGIARRRNVQGEHSALLMSHEPLYFDVLECRSGQNSSREIRRFGQRFLISQLVNRRPANHAFHGNLWTGGRN